MKNQEHSAKSHTFSAEMLGCHYITYAPSANRAETRSCSSAYFGRIRASSAVGPQPETRGHRDNKAAASTSVLNALGVHLLSVTVLVTFEGTTWRAKTFFAGWRRRCLATFGSVRIASGWTMASRSCVYLKTRRRMMRHHDDLIVVTRRRWDSGDVLMRSTPVVVETAVKRVVFIKESVLNLSYASLCVWLYLNYRNVCW